MPPRRSTSVLDQGSSENLSAQESSILDYAILPRRKAGQTNIGDRLPVRLTKEVLEQYFGMPLIMASKELVCKRSCFSHQFFSPHSFIKIGNLCNCY